MFIKTVFFSFFGIFMSIDSAENKRISRARKGGPLDYVPDKIIQGENTGNFRDKVVRENVLKDVLELRIQGKTKEQIHAFGCEKYHFVDRNPWEDRYFKYIEEKGL